MVPYWPRLSATARRCSVAAHRHLVTAPCSASKDPEKSVVRIGGASAFWGDSSLAAPQLLSKSVPKLDYLVFDYLAETTMAIMSKMREKRPNLGYATDFVQITMPAIAPALKSQGVKVIANVGGVNPLAARAALEAALSKQGVDLKIGVVLGDDLVERAAEMHASAVPEMFTGAPFPQNAKSINVYLGARPIATLLDRGCDIVLTGRVVDSAVTLGACMHEFGWHNDQYDELAGATLAGHIIECGAQASGGLFTDWGPVSSGWSEIGYPIAEVRRDGSFSVSKPDGTAGLISVGTVAEQLVYEIGDPGAYHCPDVACDFTQVRLEQEGADRVRVSNVRGQPPTDSYKVTTTYFDGFRNEALLVIAGINAGRKAQATGDALFARTRAMLAARGLSDFVETRIEVIGDGALFDPAKRGCGSAREVVLKLSAKHTDKAALDLFAREFAPSATSMAPGTMPLVPGRPTPAPLVRCFSCLVPKRDVPVRIVTADTGDEGELVPIATKGGFARSASELLPPQPTLALSAASTCDDSHSYRLVELCWARSGDKGDTANIGLIARRPEYLPFLRTIVTEAAVAEWFAHSLEEGSSVTRYELPGLHAMNFVMTRALGGGGTTTLRTDSLAKAFAQNLLEMKVAVPSEFHSSLLSDRANSYTGNEETPARDVELR